MKVNFKGTPFDTIGEIPKVGTTGRDFALASNTNDTVTRQSLMGKKTLVSVFPDITTRVCDIQTHTFFDRIGKMDTVNLVNISTNSIDDFNDWCAADGVDAILLSDPAGAFGRAYGLYIPDKNVLARAVMVLDEDGVITYLEVLEEITDEPDYDKALQALK